MVDLLQSDFFDVPGLCFDLVVPAIFAYVWSGLAGQGEHPQGVGLPHAGQQSLLRPDEFIMYSFLTC